MGVRYAKKVGALVHSGCSYVLKSNVVGAALDALSEGAALGVCSSGVSGTSSRGIDDGDSC